MSGLPDNELDLEKLFLPAWAQEPSSAKYANYQGGEETSDRRGDRRDRRGPRPSRRDRPPRAPGDEHRPRREGDRRRPEGQRPQARRPDAPIDGAPPQGGPRQRGRSRFRRPEGVRPEGPRPAPIPLPDLDVSILPEEKGVESLARQIKMTGRAYPLFDIAQLILQKPERHAFAFSVKKNAEGNPMQPLFGCALDDTIWLSEEEAIAHVLRKHFGTFYQAERTATEPPKGKYTFVAQCGMSGIILGPPNHHDYQNQLRKLHSDRFSRMPFEVYKSRIKIVRDEAVVKKWIEDQSWRTEYVCLNMPEPLKLANMEAVEKHFRETHKENIIKPLESQTLSGTAARALRSPGLTRLVRSLWEDQRRFPLQIATTLSQQFASHGLQFFKVNRTITHVSVARPHYLDLEATPVSDGVRRIVEYINAHTKCSRRQLVETLAPDNVGQASRLSPPADAASPAPAPAEPGAAPAPTAAASSAPATTPGPTPEQTAIIADLHWLIHQGHVIEFANGTLDTAKKPLPKPPKPEPKSPEPAPEASATAQSAEPTADASLTAVTDPPEATAPPTEPSASAEISPDHAPADPPSSTIEAAPSLENPSSVSPSASEFPADHSSPAAASQPELASPTAQTEPPA
ncbi:MAG: hypothetical protein C5B50_02705 [Verrucomicrobia bacterium]|nr:MAG: hypothetical protein C5B50_02705 [Verrucomicrobiota bacterium]